MKISMIPDRERAADMVSVSENDFGNVFIYKRYMAGDVTKIVQLSLTPFEAERVGREISAMADSLIKRGNKIGNKSGKGRNGIQQPRAQD